MEDAFENVNWVVTGLLGVATSVLGAFVYATFSKVISRTNEKFRNSRLDKYKNQRDLLNKLNGSLNELLLYCFKNLFYLLAMFALASALGLLSLVAFEIGAFLSASVWVATFIAGMNLFSTLVKMTDYEKHISKIEEEITILENSDDNA